MYERCFRIYLATLCLLVGAFSQFIFKIIIDMYVLITILLIVFTLFLWFFYFPFFFFCSLPCDLMTTFSDMFGFFFLCVCVCVCI